MAQNVKTIVKIFLLFFVFQISINVFGEFTQVLDQTFDEDKQEYINYILEQVNGKITKPETVIDGKATSNTLVENMEAFIKRDNLFTGGIINAFLGVLQVIGDAILFITELVITILITPGIMMNILLYNFVVSTGYLIAAKVIVIVSFYMTMYYIIFKRRVTQ
jgi:hypothetical protein